MARGPIIASGQLPTNPGVLVTADPATTRECIVELTSLNSTPISASLIVNYGQPSRQRTVWTSDGTAGHIYRWVVLGPADVLYGSGDPSVGYVVTREQVDVSPPPTL